ncbi:MAG TPA: hypothetical protein PK733_14215 [Clostridiales bacterium]|nr:hypothetical protein [Clostridiales bacterium]
MQLQGFLLMIFIFVILPVFVLFSNHTVFFIVMSVILFINSLRLIYYSISGLKHVIPEIDEEDKEFIDNIEASTGFNFKRFDTGADISKYLIIILFYIYCSFFIRSVYIKILISSVIVYWIYHIIKSFKESRHSNIKTSISSILERILNFVIGSSSAFIIAFAAYTILR